MENNKIIESLKNLSYIELLSAKIVIDRLISEQEIEIQKLKNHGIFSETNSNLHEDPTEKNARIKFNPDEFICQKCGEEGIHYVYNGFDDMDYEDCFDIFKCDNECCSQKYRLDKHRESSPYDMPRIC